MIFVTVGTLFPFDRMVRAIDEAKENGSLPEDIFAQIGNSSYHPRHYEYVNYLDKITFDSSVKESTALISHAGIGSLMLAFEYQKPILLVPRLRKYGEHVNDHQLDTARKFEQLGHVLVAYDTDELPEKINRLKTFVPTPRTPNVQGVVDRIDRFLRTGS